MNRLGALAVVVIAAAAACSSTPTPPPSPAPTTVPLTTPATSPTFRVTTAPPEGLAACTASQIRATPGDSGAAAGTSYLAVAFQRLDGADCLVPRGPAVALAAADGTVLVHDTDANPAPVTLHDQLAFHIGWNVPCGPPIPKPTLARIALYGAEVITIPIGDFGPSCVDGSTGRLFMDVDAP
jgi:hypothetical protein